jgi:4'-phosphopantetheinyl transferase EntD
MTTPPDPTPPDPTPGRPVPAIEVAGLFSGVVAYELWGGGDPETLFPAEQALVDRAVAGRLREFAAGRLCARAALAELGFEPAPLVRAVQRAPAWPPGVFGSLSHTDRYAVAVVTAQDSASAGGDGGDRGESPSVGVDAEERGRVTPDLYRRLFRPAEQDWLGTLDPEQALTEAAVMFALKESFYKAQFPLTGAWVGFLDVEIEPGGDGSHWILHPATDLEALTAVTWPVRGRALIRRELVVTGVEVTPARR